MAARGHGTMTFLASIAGITGNGAIGTYGITKGANAHLAKNMAIEWGPKGIRSNAIAPGLIKTDFAEALWKNPNRYLKIIHRQRINHSKIFLFHNLLQIKLINRKKKQMLKKSLTKKQKKLKLL